MTGPEFTAANEGFRDLAYLDSCGGWTLGIGRHHGIRAGMTCTRPQADQWFNAADYPAAAIGAAGDLGQASWANLDQVRRDALTDMAFEMGEEGLGQFAHMLAAIRSGDWQLAAGEALQSRWAKEVSTRADKVAEMILTGRYP